MYGVNACPRCVLRVFRSFSSMFFYDMYKVTPLEGRSERLAKGDEVLAVYVDTTSFYHATIAIPPRGRGAQIVSQRFWSLLEFDSTGEHTIDHTWYYGGP